MNRLRRATIVASFGYMQYAPAIASGILMVPLTLRCLGTRTYGLWLASGEVLAYAAMVDLGVIGVLPWMLAEADGHGDRAAMRRLVANGLVVGAVVGVIYGLLAALLWLLLPATLTLSAADRAVVARPLALLVMAMMVAYPLRVFSAVLAGLQDATFNGWLAVTQSLLSISLSATLLVRGFGVDALAIGSAAATLVAVFAAIARTRVVAPDLLRGWPRPSLSIVRMLLTNGLGVWGGAFGWQLVAASNGVVITALGRPEWMAVYACTAKLTSIATQLAWVLPDAGLVGLAQVQGEAPRPERLRPLVLLMLRLHLLLAGGAACGLLLFNPVFVRAWVGPELFGGLVLNTLLAAGIVAAGLVHGVLATASVIGNRVRVGAVTLMQGIVQVGAAWLCGRMWGLPGIAAAAAVTGLAISLPAGIRLLTPVTGLTLTALRDELLVPWLQRTGWLLLACVALAPVLRRASLPSAVAVTVFAGVTYLVALRPMLASLPALDAVPVMARLSRWLVRVRMFPSAADGAGRPLPSNAGQT